MPELRECIMHFTYLAFALWTFGFSIAFVLGMRFVSVHGPAWQLRSIFIDPTQDEYDEGLALAKKLEGKRKRTSRDWQLPRDATQQRRFLAEQMYELRSTDGHVRRGGADQSSLWPPGSENLLDLKLRGIQYAQRAVIFDFGHKWLMFRWLTHTSVQVYSPDEWRILQDIPRAGRHFKVAMALVFDSCTIACESHDLLFQPEWLDERPVLPPEICPQVLHDAHFPENVEFLSSVVEWRALRISTRANRRGLACVVIREHGSVFGGFGVYTVSDVFAIAGLPHTLTEEDLFDNPSRLARFLETSYVLAWITWVEMWPKLVKPALQGGHLLAPTEQQRLHAGKSWFFAWGKDTTYVSERLYELHSRAMNTNAADLFEPSLIALAMQRPRNLAHLIYGEAFWQAHRPHWANTQGMGTDPISLLFHGSSHPTHLDLDLYVPIILPPEQLRRRRMSPYAYLVKNKSLWSLTPPSKNSMRAGNTSLMSPEMRKGRLFRTQVLRWEGSVAYGPLEYCGNALVVSRRMRKATIALCKGDPIMFPPRVQMDALAHRTMRRARLLAFRTSGTGKVAIAQLRGRLRAILAAISSAKKSLKSCGAGRARELQLSIEAAGQKAQQLRDLLKPLDAARRKIEARSAMKLVVQKLQHPVTPPAVETAPISPQRRRRNADANLLLSNGAPEAQQLLAVGSELRPLGNSDRARYKPPAAPRTRRRRLQPILPGM